MQYPTTRTVAATEEQAGVTFPDPYRWLEGDDEEVQLWQKEQSELASSFVRDWAPFDDLRESIRPFMVERFASIPRHANGLWFRTHQPVGAAHPVAVVAAEPFGEGRVVYDPGVDATDAPPFLSWLSPSPDGSVLALGVCLDGSENNSMRLIDVATGAVRDDAPPHVLHDAWTGGAAWLPDSSGFFYFALTGATHAFEQKVFLQRLGEGAPTVQDIPLPESSTLDYLVVTISTDGRWALASHRMTNVIPVALLDLQDPEATWRPFVTAYPGSLAGFVADDTFFGLAIDKDAPRGRIVAIPLDSPTPDAPASWKQLVAPSQAVLRTLTPVGDLLYITEFDDTFARVQVRDRSGAALGEVPLPGRGAIAEPPFPLMSLVPRGHAEEFVFGFSTLVESWGIYRHVPGAVTIEMVKEPAVRLEGAETAFHWATSADGTRIPYHTVRLPQDGDVEGPQPALVYAYGGFNAPWVPQFPGAMAAFVAAGGIFVHAHLRGGAEYGLEWWEGGRLGNKLNCYADLYAVAEDLIARGETSSDLLALTGGSNGGLLSGVAVNQRPDLWKAVVPRVPLLDVIGAIRDPYGANAIRIEFGDPDDPDEIRRMAGFSPYHLVEDGTVYPAVFIDAGETDPRCPPWHARKWGARMQAAQAGDAPILIRIWEDVGHGWATPKDVALTEAAEWLAFVMRHVGLTPAV